jgi:hypothetical protein
VPCESEAEAVTGIPVGGVEDAKRCAAKLLDAGIRRVIVTLGANGSLLAGADGMRHVPAFEIETVDSTGAGDAFIGSLAVFLAEGVVEPEAVSRANLYAGLSTMGVGTQKSFRQRAPKRTPSDPGAISGWSALPVHRLDPLLVALDRLGPLDLERRRQKPVLDGELVDDRDFLDRLE